LLWTVKIVTRWKSFWQRDFTEVGDNCLVMWKGLDLLEATWEPLANMPLGMVQEWRRMRGEMEQEFEEEVTMGG